MTRSLGEQHHEPAPGPVPEEIEHMRLCRLRAAPLSEATEWLQAVQQFWATQLTAFSQYVAMQGDTPRQQTPRTQRGRRGR